MKICIVGLPFSGKSALFSALTGASTEMAVATRAVGVIHSDIERGFIRAEVISFEHFVGRGDIAQCRTDGTLRLEGKAYSVRDGDIINFRFAV